LPHRGRPSRQRLRPRDAAHRPRPRRADQGGRGRTHFRRLVRPPRAALRGRPAGDHPRGRRDRSGPELQAEQPARLRPPAPGAGAEMNRSTRGSATTDAGTAGEDEGFEARLANAERHLARFRATTLGHFIDGRDVAGAGPGFANRSPIDGSSLGSIADATGAEVDAACQAAADAAQAWARTPGAARRRILHRIADAIEARAEEIATLECVDTGQAWRFMSRAALRGAENFRFFADRAPDAANGLSLPTESHVNYTVRQPIGPVGVITPWNTPFMLSTWKIAPALAAGCTVVHKPAEWSPLTARLLVEIMHEAGLPAGVANLVNGIGESAG